MVILALLALAAPSALRLALLLVGTAAAAAAGGVSALPGAIACAVGFTTASPLAFADTAAALPLDTATATALPADAVIAAGFCAQTEAAGDLPLTGAAVVVAVTAAAANLAASDVRTLVLDALC